MITYEMEQYFRDRTNNHVNCVIRNMHHLALKNAELGANFMIRASDHDASKYVEPEIIPYIYVTWKYKCKDEGIDFEVPSEIQEMMKTATETHINTNSHHPEFWDSKKNKINPEDRDGIPNEMIDATLMDNDALAEMCCDWHAVGLERGNTAKEWADKNVNKRWKFTSEQVTKIYQYLLDLEDQTEFLIPSNFKNFIENRYKYR